MTNYIGSTGNVTHMAANVRQERWACRPNVNLVPYIAGSTRTAGAVTCGNCLRVIARAEALAYAMLDSMAAGHRDAVAQVQHDIQHGPADQFQDAPALRRVVRGYAGSMAYWFNKGDVVAFGNMAYGQHKAELELAFLAGQAEAAELEAHAEVTRIHDVAAAEVIAHKYNPTGETFLVGLGSDLELHVGVDWTTSTLFRDAVVMNRELDLAKDEVFERPEITTPGSIPGWTDEELAENEQRARRLAQRQINRNDAAGAADLWFSMWAARREQAYRAQMLPQGHAFK